MKTAVSAEQAENTVGETEAKSGVEWMTKAPDI